MLTSISPCRWTHWSRLERSWWVRPGARSNPTSPMWAFLQVGTITSSPIRQGWCLRASAAIKLQPNCASPDKADGLWFIMVLVNEKSTLVLQYFGYFCLFVCFDWLAHLFFLCVTVGGVNPSCFSNCPAVLCHTLRGELLLSHHDRLPGQRRGHLPQPGRRGEPGPPNCQVRLQVAPRWAVRWAVLSVMTR